LRTVRVLNAEAIGQLQRCRECIPCVIESIGTSPGHWWRETWQYDANAMASQTYALRDRICSDDFEPWRTLRAGFKEPGHSGERDQRTWCWSEHALAALFECRTDPRTPCLRSYPPTLSLLPRFSKDQ